MYYVALLYCLLLAGHYALQAPPHYKTHILQLSVLLWVPKRANAHFLATHLTPGEKKQLLAVAMAWLNTHLLDLFFTLKRCFGAHQSPYSLCLYFHNGCPKIPPFWQIYIQCLHLGICQLWVKPSSIVHSCNIWNHQSVHKGSCKKRPFYGQADRKQMWKFWSNFPLYRIVK